MPESQKPYPLQTIPGLRSNSPGIQIAAQTTEDATDEDLQFLQQLGVEWVMLSLNDSSLHSVNHYRQFMDRYAAYDIQIYRIGNHGVHNVPEITLNLKGREAKIDELCEFIRNLGEAGIRYHTYAHMANGIWSSERKTRRGGMSTRSLDLSTAKGHWIRKIYEGELTHGREYSEDELWENFDYLI